VPFAGWRNMAPQLRVMIDRCFCLHFLAMFVRHPSGFIEPFLPSKAARPPSGRDWVHEMRHDGYRLMVRRDVHLPIRHRQHFLVAATAICSTYRLRP
jgi:hypothetical protein